MANTPLCAASRITSHWTHAITFFIVKLITRLMIMVSIVILFLLFVILFGVFGSRWLHCSGRRRERPPFAINRLGTNTKTIKARWRKIVLGG